jgi:tetratricopeptide (TPR) repeat protein
MLALDFEGSARVCDSILQMKTLYPVGQPQTIGRIAKGYSAIAAGFTELDRGRYNRAIELFNEVCDPNITPKFFLHWAWRMTAQLGMTEAWLQSADIEKASVEADVLLRSVLQTADPHLQALAWEMQARIALSRQDWMGAKNCIHKALEIVRNFEVPIAAWQVHATAWRLYLCKQEQGAAESHRHAAKGYILKIADSFAHGEPLRETFLSAGPVARILNPSADRGQALDA